MHCTAPISSSTDEKSLSGGWFWLGVRFDTENSFTASYLQTSNTIKYILLYKHIKYVFKNILCKKLAA